MTILHWISADSWRRFTASVLAAALVYLVFRQHLSVPLLALAAWDSFAAFSALLAWSAIIATPQTSLRKHARAQDLGRMLLFGFVVIAACVALLAVGILVRTHHADMRTEFTLDVTVALGTVALSWMLLHTVYSLHYAHVYYGDRDKDEAPDEGLIFPGDQPPDYFDFAYFSFVIGMTCQVSDVQVSSKRMRRLTLIHGVISFAFNTAILALLINTISGLL